MFGEVIGAETGLVVEFEKLQAAVVGFVNWPVLPVDMVDDAEFHFRPTPADLKPRPR
jgi:hypothetical protein